jgi:hypothetical protein
MHLQPNINKKVAFLVMTASLLLAITTLATAQSDAARAHYVSGVNLPTQQTTAAQADYHSIYATDQCTYPFATGTANSYIGFCVSVNGNIVQLATPFGHEHIAVPGATISEGYGVCNETPATEYHDWAGSGDSGNWNATNLVSLSATSVKFSRTTSDGIWTLTQTISLVSPTSSAKIVMTLKNNTAAPRVAYLVRYADISADGRFVNNQDSTNNSAAAWNTTGSANPYGVVLQNVGNPGFSFWNGYVQNTSQPPNACAFAFNYTGPQMGVNGSVVMAYVQKIPANSSKTATMIYKGF